MLRRFRLIRNVGTFDSFARADLPFGNVTLIFAENGRGKTTLASIFRSLSTGDPLPISERHRLTSPDPPHIVLDCDGPPARAVFQNGMWSRRIPDLMLFDDFFVETNVCSGLVVSPEHRQNLYELILGSQGVLLNQQLQQVLDQIEQHISAIRGKSEVISSFVRDFAVDDFCALANLANIDQAIFEAKRHLAAVQEQEAIQAMRFFDPLCLPSLDVQRINRILAASLESLDTLATERVKKHFSALGSGGETWVLDGMSRLSHSTEEEAQCPFCGQNLEDSPLLDLYRAYFSEAYQGLQQEVTEVRMAVERAFGRDSRNLFSDAVRATEEARAFWSRFCDVPNTGLNAQTICQDWQRTFEEVAAALDQKNAAPLDQIALSATAQKLVSLYEEHSREFAAEDSALQQTNRSISAIKQRATASSIKAAETELARLEAIKLRYRQDVDLSCREYLAEKAAKAQAETVRDRIRAQLEHYKATTSPAYQATVNRYLRLFNVGFQLDRVISVNQRSGNFCNYQVVINNTPVTVAGGTPQIGAPPFRNTLSAGDRSTLALAFFFASLEQDPSLQDKVIIIDDPVSSLDEHRSFTTVQVIRRFVGRANQVIVLSHNRQFLCRLWGQGNGNPVALRIIRNGAGSIIDRWDVAQDSVTDYDRRHALLRGYLVNGQGDLREVAMAIRPLLEAFLRVALPEHFLPTMLLGPFWNHCTQLLGTPIQVLDQGAIQELRDLTEYANRFHHDTNPAWETELINEQELEGFVRRALDFARR